MDIETCWYEFSPYIYIVIGVLSIFYATTHVGRLSAGLLIIAALTIVRMRWTYRKAQDAKIRRAGDRNYRAL
jgi:hypothetical protein